MKEEDVIDDPLADIFPGTYYAPLPAMHYPKTPALGIWLTVAEEEKINESNNS